MYLPDFLWKHRRPITLIALLIVSSLLMIDSLHRRWVTRAGGTVVLGLASPVQKVSEGVYGGGRNLFSAIPNVFRAHAQNVNLQKRIGELEQEIAALEEQLLQERRLLDLTDFADRIDGSRIIARVIGTNPTAWFSTVTVEKGSSHGIRKGLPVVSSSGLAGHIIEVFPFSSKVLLLTDSNSKVSIVVQRSRAQGIVQGDDGGCVLKYLEATGDVQDGDIVVTSGNSRIYPQGLRVGTVVDVKHKPGSLFKWARVIPATEFRKLEEVAVIVPLEQESQGEIAAGK